MEPPPGSAYAMHLLDEESSTSRLKRFFHNFKRDPNSAFFPSGDVPSRSEPDGTGPHYDLRRAAFENAHSGGLMRRLKGRHLQMIAMGGSIGK
jgi:amino acid transporter